MVRYETVRIALRARRKQLGLTQRAVADRMGTSQSNVNQLESGVNANPTIETLNAWCRALGGRLDLGVVFDDQEKPLLVCWLETQSPEQTCSCVDNCIKEQDLKDLQESTA